MSVPLLSVSLSCSKCDTKSEEVAAIYIPRIRVRGFALKVLDCIASISRRSALAVSPQNCSAGVGHNWTLTRSIEYRHTAVIQRSGAGRVGERWWRCGGSADGLALLVLAILALVGQWCALSYVRIEARARVTPALTSRGGAQGLANRRSSAPHRRSERYPGLSCRRSSL